MESEFTAVGVLWLIFIGTVGYCSLPALNPIRGRVGFSRLGPEIEYL